MDVGMFPGPCLLWFRTANVVGSYERADRVQKLY